MFIALFATSIVSATTTISSVDYPESILEGEGIEIVVYFKYDSYGDYLIGPYVYVDYSINSISISGVLAIKHSISAISRATYLVFAIPTTNLIAGDVIRFQIRYKISTGFLDMAIETEEITSGTYRIDIKGVDQTSLSALGIGIALIMIVAIFTTKKHKLARV